MVATFPGHFPYLTPNKPPAWRLCLGVYRYHLFFILVAGSHQATDSEIILKLMVMVTAEPQGIWGSYYQ